MRREMDLITLSFIAKIQTYTGNTQLIIVFGIGTQNILMISWFKTILWTNLLFTTPLLIIMKGLMTRSSELQNLICWQEKASGQGNGEHHEMTAFMSLREQTSLSSVPQRIILLQLSAFITGGIHILSYLTAEQEWPLSISTQTFQVLGFKRWKLHFLRTKLNCLW